MPVAGFPPSQNTSCPVCLLDTQSWVRALTFSIGPREVLTSVYACGHCGSVWRDLSGCRSWREAYFSTGPYNDRAEGEQWRGHRQALFAQCRAILRQVGHGSGRLLDVGCAYGHLLNSFSKYGWVCVGIEIAPRLRAHLQSNGQHRVYRNADDLPPTETFDAITLIDSLNCNSEPYQYLTQLTQLLAPQGVILLRIANRALAVRLFARWLPSRWLSGLLGDQVVAVTYHGIEVMAERLGLCILAVEQETVQSYLPRQFPRWLCHRRLPAVGKLTGMRASPGLLCVLTRSDANSTFREPAATTE